MLGNDVERFFTPEGVAAGYPAKEMWLALETGHANDKRWHLRKGGDHAERDRMCEMSLDLLQVISLDGIVERINPAWTTILDFAPRDMTASASETLLLLVSRLRYKGGSDRWFTWPSAPAGDVIYATGRHVIM